MDKKDFKPIGPFFGWVLENFPFIEVDFDAITNYELLCKVVEYINKIGYNQELLEESNNELIDAFNELKTYVESYLENLDVQGYVDNKLDEMAESGELSDLIEKYIQVSGILAYNTLDDLENASNLENGSFTRIFGKLTYNDGLGSYYKIRNVLTTDVIDGDNIITLVNYPELVGEKIFSKDINDLKEEVSSLQEDVGDIDNLNTTEKSNIVGAINEVNANSSNNTTAIGILSNLNTTEKSNIVGAINEINGKFSGLIITDEFTSDSITINANSTFSYSFDISKTGYKVLGILWVDCFSNDVVLAKYSQYDNTSYVRFRNMASTNITTNYKIKVLYIKN